MVARTSAGAEDPELSGLGWVDTSKHTRPLPHWAVWFINLGAITTRLDSKPAVRRWIIVSVPDRRFAASLIAHGVVCARAANSGPLPIEARFDGREAGSKLTWIDANGENRFGKLIGIADGRISYRRRVHGGWGTTVDSRPLENADSFWPAEDDGEFSGARQAAATPAFVTAAVGIHADQILSSSDIDTLLIGTRTDLQADLSKWTFTAGGARGALIDTVRPRELVPRGQHHRSAIISATSDPDDTLGSSCHGPAVFDGAGGYLRHRDSVEAATNIVVLDRWHPRSEDAAAVARIERNETWVAAPPTPYGEVPAAIEVFEWTEAL